jgi:hypothetical protein
VGLEERQCHDEESLQLTLARLRSHFLDRLSEALARTKDPPEVSLIQEGKSQQTYEIHRLVQLSTQWWLGQEKSLTKWQERALDILFRHCPSSDNVEDWKAWESISPHITILQGYQFQQEEQKAPLGPCAKLEKISLG